MKHLTKTLIIAEAGVNHNGDLGLAKQLIDAAADSTADIVKFQTFQANKLVTPQALQAPYQEKATEKKESQLSMLKRFELTNEQHGELYEYSQSKDIEFLTTAFDWDSTKLVESLDLMRWKIPSGEITNLPFLRYVGSLGKPIILSTGMATLIEIGAAIKELEQAGSSRSLITVLHCTTAYPTPCEEVNLRAMKSIAQEFGVDVGYSDHTKGIDIPIAAVAMGATIIEKHLTLHHELPGPDHAASLNPTDFAAMVRAIRSVELALGDGVKRTTISEEANLNAVRKSIVASKPIRSGDFFTADNLTTKRPGTGISPMHWDALIGRQATRDFSIDELIG